MNYTDICSRRFKTKSNSNVNEPIFNCLYDHKTLKNTLVEQIMIHIFFFHLRIIYIIQGDKYDFLRIC